ncbi:hypothetical protein CP556_11855 [Natrinema sp. CBA1119]|uniref:DUF7344 domain-containing protein n=1 Tax=Natrinema sp. CBA1119 TaxID=1608465 RepID=UPI000BF44BBF|nr:hypothetical protein [Natrinema sp. CBA1119]PGF16743.1 hypothetical protein CP556_11855 [Natrinema sp. CBA1119]
MTDQDGAESEDPAPIDSSFTALSDPSRRSLCRYAMRTETERVSSEELVDYVVERAPEPVAADADRQTIALELHHVHLPKLANAGLIEYDRQNDVVHVDRATIADRLERARDTISDLQDA